MKNERFENKMANKLTGFILGSACLFTIYFSALILRAFRPGPAFTFDAVLLFAALLVSIGVTAISAVLSKKRSDEPDGILNIFCFFVPVSDALVLFRCPVGFPYAYIPPLLIAVGALALGVLFISSSRKFKFAAVSALAGTLLTPIIIVIWKYIDCVNHGYPEGIKYWTTGLL